MQKRWVWCILGAPEHQGSTLQAYSLVCPRDPCVQRDPPRGGRQMSKMTMGPRRTQDATDYQIRTLVLHGYNREDPAISSR